MILEELPVRVHCRQINDGAFALQYYCPLSGVLRRVPVRKSGQFADKETALDWASKNIIRSINARIAFSAKQRWRLNTALLKHFNDYSIWRKVDRERSVNNDLSMIRNYMLPFFVTEMKLSDPNRWGDFGEEFSNWLQKDAITKTGGRLAPASVIQAISACNQFMKWMRRRKIIDFAKYRSIESIDSRLLQRRDYKDLVTDEVFRKVHEYLSAKNQLSADMWHVQRHLGFRVNELIGLAFHWLSEECPQFIKEEFESKGKVVFGSVYLESQPTKQYIVREEDGSIPRSRLKGRPRIGPEFSRTIPVLNEITWDIFVRRYEEQCDEWDKKTYGDKKESYLLFTGAQSFKYRQHIREAFESIGLKSPGTHMLRHTLSTEWTGFKISEKISELVLGHKANAHQLYVHIVALVNWERSKAAPMPRLRKNVEN